MSDSLAEWLALREPFDTAARSVALTRAVAEALHTRPTLGVVDLGTGRGSNLRYLTGHFAQPQRWLLVDQDASLLADVPRAMVGRVDPRCTFETRQANLGVLDASLFEARQLVTASALLDLVSETWLQSLAAYCGAHGAVALFALTYNGGSECSPADPYDEVVRELMNRHQQANDKGFGRAAGPDAVAAAVRSFSECGYRVERARSDWVLPPEARALQRLLVDGWADAAAAMAPSEAATIQDWHRRRIGHIEAGHSHIGVGHEDLAALPRL